MAAAAGGGPARSRSVAFDQQAAFDQLAAPAAPVIARPVTGTVAAEWQLARPVAVPGDGTPHRTVVAEFALPARLDHLTAPALGPTAYLRATGANDTGQVLLAGPVSTFVDGAFVGTTGLSLTAPGADVELPLGVDDRVVVTRELTERTAHKARFGSSLGSVERWTIEVENRRPTPARVLVRDRLPVSRAADIKIVDVALTPEPTERDELGRVEWVALVEPDRTWRATLRFGVEHPRQTPIDGWS